MTDQPTSAISPTICSTITPVAPHAGTVVEVNRDMLVAGNVMRFQSMPPTLARVLDVRPPSKKMVEATASLDRKKRKALTVGLPLMFGSIGSGAWFSTFIDDGPLGYAALITVMLMALTGVYTTIAPDAAESEVRRQEDARAGLMPAPAAEAVKRARSASREILDTEAQHAPETIANARVAADMVAEIAIRLADHANDGTSHTPAAQALTGEVIRIASEMDAYLLLHNSQQFAPAEDDALTLLAGSSAIHFP